MRELDFVPEPANPRPFRDALGCFATGIAVVTTLGRDGPVGITANSFSAVSLDPPLVLWSPARASSRFPVFAEADAYAIHILAEDQLDLSARFTRGGLGFSGIEHRLGEDGVPVIPEALARFECRRHAAHDGGDHVIIVGQVRRVVLHSGEPLIFSRGRYGGFHTASA